MEYVEGGELFKYIVDNVCLEEMEAVRIFRQIMSAVSYCHNFELCHRDIKPENILLDHMGNVKLADFGMATREHHGGLVTSCGSPHYAPPEIALGHPYIGSQVDIWSCGVVLFVMLAGYLPFGGRSKNYDIQYVLQEIVTSPPDWPAEMTDEARDLIDRMLDKEPTSRITSEGIWCHPLITLYDRIAKNPDYAPYWSSGPPAVLTAADCGDSLQKKDIDMDILNSLCTLWHSIDQEEMICALVDPKPTYQKIIYRNLLKFRTEQEENYQGSNVELSGSDYHHVHRKPLQRIATKADLLGDQKRSASRFSIALPQPKKSRSQCSIAVAKRSSSKITIKEPSSSRRSSQRSEATNRSYDPFRASHTPPPIPKVDHATITVLSGSSSSRFAKSSKSIFVRHPTIARLQRESTLITQGSLPSFARDNEGNIKTLRRSTIMRQDSTSSWASTRMSSHSVKQFHASSSVKKGVIFVHSRRSSSVQQLPPPRPRNPTPLTIQQRYVKDSLPPSDFDTPTNEFASNPPSSFQDLPQLQIRKERPLSVKKDRNSMLWEERTRQVSIELSNLCDEVFQGTLPGTDIWDAEQECEKQKDFARKSIDLPSLRSTGFNSIQTSSGIFPVQPKLREIYAADTYRELARVKERLQKGADALGSDELQGLIEHIDRLMNGNQARQDVSSQDGRRIASAPDPRSSNHNALSPVKEEDEYSRFGWIDRSRHVSSPVKGRHGGFEQSSTRPPSTTIRLVNDDSREKLFPRPLTIRKKASEPILGPSRATEEHKRAESDIPAVPKPSQMGRLKLAQGSSAALDKLFKRDRASAESLMLPYENGDGVNRHSKCSSNDGKPRNWFRRSTGSGQSIGSDERNTTHAVSVVASSHEHLLAAGSFGTSQTASDDMPIPIRFPHKESAAAKFFKWFRKEKAERRMQIAMTSKFPCRFHDW
jgi:serine/threonine-protein kinase HSL1, negative regulator of Swe1 kinase